MKDERRSAIMIRGSKIHLRAAAAAAALALLCLALCSCVRGGGDETSQQPADSAGISGSGTLPEISVDIPDDGDVIP
jgi:hypothetical protein